MKVQKLKNKNEQGFALEDKDSTNYLHSAMSHHQVMVEKTYWADLWHLYKKVTYTFTTQLIIYLLEKLKCKYIDWFLMGIPLDDWNNYQRCIKIIKVPEWSHTDFLEMHQDRLNPKYI